MELQQFRPIFYFFQYQFYLRSERADKKGTFAMLPCGNIGQFLFQLAEHPEEMHYRWDPIDIRPRPAVKRKKVEGPTLREYKKIKKQLVNPPDHFPVKSFQGRTIIYKAKKKSIRCRYMLFDFPKGFRKDQIVSLYKSLIVHDLIRILGYKPWNVARAIIDKNLSDYVAVRGKTHWEIVSGEWFERISQFIPIGENVSEADVKHQRSFEYLFLRNVFTNIADNSKLASKAHSGEDKHCQVQRIYTEVQRYLQRAELLVEIAATGRFSNFPSELQTFYAS